MSGAVEGGVSHVEKMRACEFKSTQSPRFIPVGVRAWWYGELDQGRGGVWKVVSGVRGHVFGQPQLSLRR
jgi:hypothetical protein